MANKMFAEVVIAGSYKNLSKSTRGATKELSNFEKGAKKISGAVKAAFAGIALMGVGMMTDAIIDLTKAAEGDAKTTNKLNKSLDNTWKATDQTKKSVADYIDKMSNLTGIVDDELRPAYATLARQTKSQEKANKLLNVSMDIAADKNITVEKAARLVAKAMSGNKKAFDKLYPSASKSGDALKYVTEQAKGMAMAGTGPIDRINNVIENFKEKLGAAFLPIAEDIADWLAGPEAQATLDDIATKVKEAFAWLTSPEGKAQMKEWMDQFMVLIKGAMDLAMVVADLLGGSKKRDASLTAALNTRAGSAAFNFLGGGPTGKFAYTSAEALSKTSGNMSSVGNTTVINVTATQASGKEVVSALTAYARGKGIPMSKLLK